MSAEFFSFSLQSGLLWKKMSYPKTLSLYDTVPATGDSLLAPIPEFVGQKLWFSVGLVLPMDLSSVAMEIGSS